MVTLNRDVHVSVILRLVADVTADLCRGSGEPVMAGHRPGEGCDACDIYHRVMEAAEAMGYERP